RLDDRHPVNHAKRRRREIPAFFCYRFSYRRFAFLAGLRADFFAAGFFALFFFAAGFALPPSAPSACGRVLDFGRDFKPPPTYSLNCLAGMKRGAFFAGRAAKWRISPVNGSLLSPALRAAVTFCLNLP